MHVSRWRTLLKNIKLQLSINTPGTGSRYLKVHGALADDSLLKDVPNARSLLFQLIPTSIPFALSEEDTQRSEARSNQADRQGKDDEHTISSFLAKIN